MKYNNLLNIVLNDFYHKESFLNEKPGNISRWSKKNSKVILLNSVNNVNCEIYILNVNPKNKFITTVGSNYSYKFQIEPGLNILKFKHDGDYIEFITDTVLYPKKELGTNDDRELGVVILNLSIENFDINIVTKIHSENLKVIEKYNNISFTPKEILGKKVGIIGYVPPNKVSITSSFLSNINSFKSYADIILFSDDMLKNTIYVEDPLTVVERNNHKIGLWTFFKCLNIAKNYNLDYFLMIESDGRVLKQNWDYDLFEEAIRNDAYAYGSLNISNYRTDDKIFSYINTLSAKSKYPCIKQGDVDGDSVTRIWTNGAFSVYKTSIYYELLNQNIESLFYKWSAWDYDCCKMIMDKFGPIEASKRILHANNIASNVESSLKLNYVIDKYRSFSAIHPVKTNWKPPEKETYSFYHGGDLGDIIYSLPAIKILGDGNITFGNKDANINTRERFTPSRYKFLKPLIEYQSYIKTVSYSDDTTSIYDYNFNEFRLLWNNMEYRQSKNIHRLVDINLDLVGVKELYNENEQWLSCSKKKVAKYVVARSFRYRDPNFPWNRIYHMIKNDCIFLGFEDEYQDFCKNVGLIRHIKINNALEMAEVINGDDLFIGNQSFPCSIALGLNRNVIQEYSELQKDCIFDKRINFKTKENYIEMLSIIEKCG